MFHEKLSPHEGTATGAVSLFTEGGGRENIGNVHVLDNGDCELVLSELPSPGQKARIEFFRSLKPGRHPLAALIETPFSEVRVEIGQVDVHDDISADICFFGMPDFPARLIF